MIKAIKGLSLLDILPDSILQDEQVAAAAKALDTELQKVTAATIEALHLPRLDELPETVLDLLAWQWHVDFYEPLGMDVETKRKLIKQSIAWHRMKGTPAAVEAVVSAAFDTSTVQEWFEYGGQPYYFKVVTEDVTTEKEKLDGMRRAIASVKNARSWLESIEFLLHLQDTETPTENALLTAWAEMLEYYPWRGHYFNGAYMFGGCETAGGTWLHDGQHLFDGLADHTTAPDNLHPYIFDGQQLFDGGRRFVPYASTGRIFFDTLEIDPLIAIVEPELAEAYGVTIEHDAAISFDGAQRYGWNAHPQEKAVATATALSTQDKLTTSDTPAVLESTARQDDIYPLHRLRYFDGTWGFGTPIAFNGAAWFAGEWRFDAAAPLADPVEQGQRFDDAYTFDGAATFDVPHPAARYDAGTEQNEHVETAQNMSMSDTMSEGEATSTATSLLTIEQLAARVFDGTHTFDGSTDHTTHGAEAAGEELSPHAAEQLATPYAFDGTLTYDGTTTAGRHAGPNEAAGLTVQVGRWFDGTITFNAGGARYFDGTTSYTGNTAFGLSRDCGRYYDGKMSFDGLTRYARAGETFALWQYSA